MKYVFFIILIVSTTAWSQIKHQTRVSKEIPGKTNEEIKQLVLFNGAMDAIKVNAQNLGYDFGDFTKKLSQNFNSYYESYKDHELAQKFGKGYATTLSQADKDGFTAGLDKKKDFLFQRFSKVIPTIQSYSVKEGKVDLVLDKVKVEHLLRRIIHNESKAYAKVWILSEVNLTGLTWENFELLSSESFKEPIESSWAKWMGTHMPANVEEAGLCRKDCLATYNSWEQKHQDEVFGGGGPDFINTIWAKVTFNLKAGTSTTFYAEKVYEWEGRIVLIDVNTKRVLASLELPMEKKTFREIDQKKINSDLASLLYRTGVSGFTQLTNKLQNQMALNRVTRLSILGYKHLSDVLGVMEELKTRGSSLGLDVQIDFFKSSEAQILCFYQGEEKSFTDLLSRVKELKLSQSYKLVNEFNGIHHSLKLVTE